MERLLILCFFVFVPAALIDAAPKAAATGKDHKYPFCELCIHMAEAAKDMIESKKTFTETRSTLIGLCDDWLGIHGQKGPLMCPGLVDSYGPPAIDIFAQAWFSPMEICEKTEFCPKNSDYPIKTWNNARLTPLFNHDGLVKPMDYVENVDHLQPIRILQLTDIHMDRKYKEGTPVECGMIICCREGVGMNGSGSAGRYGEYKCDLPIATLDLLMDQLRQLDPQPNFTVYTGDNPPHNVWNETWDDQTESTKFIVDYLSKNLPNQTIYPAMGNHETFPESFYYAPTYGNLTSSLAEFWQQWVKLPSSALQTIRDGGYYTMLIRPGLRLMSVNTDFGSV